MKCLHRVFLPRIIRRTKSMVIEEMDLPEKEILVKTLIFSPFEMALYKEQSKKVMQGDDNLLLRNQLQTS